MGVIGKLALTVVMFAIGAAPALSLASDPFLPGGREPPAPQPAALPSVPASELAGQSEDPPSEPATAIVAIPQSEAEWAAWTALNVGWREPPLDPVDDAGSVIAWPDIEPIPAEPQTLPDGWELDPSADPYADPGIDADSEPSTAPDEGAFGDELVTEGEPEGEGGLLGILGD